MDIDGLADDVEDAAQLVVVLVLHAQPRVGRVVGGDRLVGVSTERIARAVGVERVLDPSRSPSWSRNESRTDGCSGRCDSGCERGMEGCSDRTWVRASAILEGYEEAVAAYDVPERQSPDMRLRN